MNYAIFMIVTAVTAYALNYLTAKIWAGARINNQSDRNDGHALRCIISFILLLVTLFLPIKSAVINLGIEFAALVNFFATLVLYTFSGIKTKRLLKKQRKAEKLANKK